MADLIGPLSALAVVFFALAAYEWQRVPALGRIALGVATALLIGGIYYPGMHPNEVVARAHDGIAYLVAAARVVGVAAVLASAVVFMRDQAFGR